MSIKDLINNGEAVMGIELGSTRVKAVLIDGAHNPVASGAHDWESRLENGLWTYSLDEIWSGVQDCFKKLSQEVLSLCGAPLKRVAGIGVSAMMHGYLPFDKNGDLLVPFRTWRNTVTGESAGKLSELFDFNIPQRWSIAHLYQAILNKEDHVKDVAFIATLAGYVHWRLTGEKVAGVGDASGMFPIGEGGEYDLAMLERFDRLVSKNGFEWSIKSILPRILPAGARAGSLTAEGARLIDPSGMLEAGAPFCPPEGDAGTGMAATNSVSPRSCNVSAGTSIFAMAVLERRLSRRHPEIDIVTTPDGAPVAMVHCNSCTGDIDAWVRMFGEFAAEAGVDIPKTKLYDLLYYKALKGKPDCRGMVSFNFLSGEPVVGADAGCPMFARAPGSELLLADFMRAQLYSAIAALRCGMDILRSEDAGIDSVTGHGGLFKTPGVGQRFLAAALNTPVTVLSNAGEGGPWGMALLCAYMLNRSSGEDLAGYLSERVFKTAGKSTVSPLPEDVKGFSEYIERYKLALAAERAAAQALK